MGGAPVSDRDPLVRLGTTDGIATIVLDDASHRNALSWAMVCAVTRAVGDAVRAGCGALILTNTPPVFCAGGSVDDLLSPKAPLEDMYGAFNALARAPIPTVAAVDGAAIGAGINLALACDVAICTPRSRFDVRFLDVGIHPGGGQLWHLRQLLGRQGAAAMSLFGEVLEGEEAARRGLVWRRVETGELRAEAERLAGRAGQHDKELTARVKRTLDATAAIDDHEAAVAGELEPQRWSMERPAFEQSLVELRERLGKSSS
jgi:enoyl-CoA hydratase